MSNWLTVLTELGDALTAAEQAEAAAKAAKDQASEALTTARNAVETAKAQIVAQMLEVGVISEPALGFIVANGRETVEAAPDADPNNLAPHLVKWTPTPDKAAILAALKSGEQVPGWTITTGAPHLTRRKAKTENSNGPQ